MDEVIIIGAGIVLRGQGLRTRVFDKARALGGRMAVRRLMGIRAEALVDLGAQFFTARSEIFKARVLELARRGAAAPWSAAGPDAFVGAPGMDAPLKIMAEGLKVALEAEAVGVRREGRLWRVDFADRAAVLAERVVLALPAELAGALAPPDCAEIRALAARSKSAPCWTLAAAFAEPLTIGADCLRLDGVLSSAVRDSAKPGRQGPEAWVVHAGPEASAARLDHQPQSVQAELLEALAALNRGPLPEILALSAHCWRYARSGRLDVGAHWRPDLGFGVCGDWLQGPRVEAAFLSGDLLAQRILA
jgi:predicted NAD/FAD-dependent oxidoreductase